MTNGTFICQKFLLIILWGFTIHKSSVKTLDRVAIYLVKSDNSFWVALVSLYHVYNLKHFLLEPCYLGWSLKINCSDSLPLILPAIQKLNAKADTTKKDSMMFIILLINH